MINEGSYAKQIYDIQKKIAIQKFVALCNKRYIRFRCVCHINLFCNRRFRYMRVILLLLLCKKLCFDFRFRMLNSLEKCYSVDFTVFVVETKPINTHLFPPIHQYALSYQENFYYY